MLSSQAAHGGLAGFGLRAGRGRPTPPFQRPPRPPQLESLQLWGLQGQEDPPPALRIPPRVEPWVFPSPSVSLLPSSPGPGCPRGYGRCVRCTVAQVGLKLSLCHCIIFLVHLALRRLLKISRWEKRKSLKVSRSFDATDNVEVGLAWG